MIQHGYEMDFTKQNFGVILYGAPGVGKTTAALSDGANGANTLLLDLERGVGRTKPVHRMNAMVLTADNYEEVKAGLNTPEAAKAETIVIDTCGALVDFIKDWVFRTKDAARTRTGEWNGLKGFGFVKAEMDSFTNHIKNVLHKNVVYIFHCDEKADKDGNAVQRLRCEGAFRNTVWTGIDFGGYIQMLGNQRVACFSPMQEYFAKGCHGIEGQIPIPNLAPGAKNDFLQRIFDTARKNMQAEQDELGPLMDQYNKVMEVIRNAIENITDVASANSVAADIPTMPHVLTSKAEASAMLKEKTKSMGLQWSSKANGYVPAALSNQQAGDAK